MARPGRVLTTLIAVAALTVAGGCSSDPDDAAGPGSDATSTGGSAGPGTDPASVDEAGLRAGLVGLWTGDDTTPRDTRNGECFADALLERTTPEQLRQGGVLDASYAVVASLPVLDAATAEPWVDAQLSCTDFVEESTRALVAQSKGKIARADYAACLREELSDTELRAALVQTLTGGFESPEVAGLSDAQQSCAKAALPAD